MVKMQMSLYCLLMRSAVLGRDPLDFELVLLLTAEAFLYLVLLVVGSLIILDFMLFIMQCARNLCY